VASYELARLNEKAWVANAYSVRLASNARVANVNIVIARGKILTRSMTHRDVVATGCVINERIMTNGCVLAAASVPQKRIKAAGGVVDAIHVAIERLNTIGRIVVAGVLLYSA
jgi:hypothetical protein